MAGDAAAAAFRQLREQFPITATRAYLFAGGMAPLSLPSRAALEDWAALWATDPVAAYREHPRESGERLRAEVARVIRARPQDVAIVDSTSRGNNLAVQMLAAPVGANVVFDATTYPSAVAPWLLREGVEIRRALAGEGTPSLAEIRRLVDERTIAVSVSYVCRLSGYRHDLSAVAEVAHAVGAVLVVDAAQAVGVVPLDVEADGVDFVSFGAMKWLLGAPGIAFFHVRPELQERLAPPQAGGGGVRVEDGRIVAAPGGSRHELGSLAWGELEASRRGLALLLGHSEAAREARVLELSGLVVEGLLERGAEVRTPRDPAQRAGIVAFAHRSPDALCRFLRGRGVDVWGWEQRGLVRVDPHVYNDEEDLERFFASYDAFNLSGN